MSSIFKYTLAGLAVVLAGGALAGLHLDNNHLRRRVEETRRAGAQLDRVREENERMRVITAQADTDAGGAAASIHARVGELRAEIARLEKQAREAHGAATASAAADAEMLANNRDLRRGAVRLEHFSDVGRATPEAAFQTLVWAALNGKEADLAAAIALPDAVRAAADALIAGLPPEARASWTPEKLGALFFSGFFTEMIAAQIQEVKTADAQRATIAVRVSSGSKSGVVGLNLMSTGDGWRIELPEKAIGSLKKRLEAEGKR
ncbi:MAG TPA: hypothetical protein VM029_15910 [Opitutaceae bacterium]|nr:hypothetical protein [Opitutaceae bacterium]